MFCCGKPKDSDFSDTVTSTKPAENPAQPPAIKATNPDGTENTTSDIPTQIPKKASASTIFTQNQRKTSSKTINENGEVRPKLYFDLKTAAMRNREIENQLKKEQQELLRQKANTTSGVLLGIADAGKSTVVKQMKMEWV